MPDSDPAMICWQAQLDQLWAQITATVDQDPKGALKAINTLRKVAQGEAVLDMDLTGPQMKQICWFAMAAMTEGIYRVEKRKQEKA